MTTCNSVGNYILFRTGSSVPTRIGSRFESCGQEYYSALVAKKRKYYILKNPPNTIQLPIKSCLTTSFTITVGKRIYAIDPVIYDTLTASLALNPVYTLDQLQQQIKLARIATGTLPPMSVQLAQVPISDLYRRYTYNYGPSQNLKMSDLTKPVYSYPFKMGFRTDLAFLSDSSYLEYFGAKLDVEYSRFIQISNNILNNLSCENAGTSNTILQFYPGGISDVFGTTILTKHNYDAFNNGTKIAFEPIFVYIQPESNIKHGGHNIPISGIISGIDLSISNDIDTELSCKVFNEFSQTGESYSTENALKKYSEIVFTPIKTDLQRIDNLDYYFGMGFNVVLTDGGFTSIAALETLLSKVTKDQNTKLISHTI